MRRQALHVARQRVVGLQAQWRGIDDEVWKAARVDGIPKWRTYLQIVLPMMRPVLITTFVIVASGCVRVYDIVVALTDGGPGTSSKVPAQYVYQHLFQGGIAQGLAASTMMLLASATILIFFSKT